MSVTPIMGAAIHMVEGTMITAIILTGAFTARVIMATVLVAVLAMVYYLLILKFYIIF